MQLANVAPFRAFFDRHVGFVWRAARACGVPDADVEDVVQETFVIASGKLGEVALDADGAARAWLYTICANLARNRRKRAEHRLRRATPVEELTSLAAREATPDAETERRQARTRLEALVARLDEDKRAVLVLYELEGLPMKDVAAAVGCPLKTAYSRLRLAREQLERWLEEEEAP
jgi:RNA polymerase sigma-70 factor (ECF subfamily)